MFTAPLSHPAFSYYGPADPPWPWILVIGQEPDADLPVGPHVGPYSLDQCPRTTFWTWSHKAVGRAVGLPDLRAWAVLKGASPIAYADASPAGYAVGGSAVHPTVTEAALRSHAAGLLELAQTRRCDVVLISGRKAAFSPFYGTVEPVFRAWGATMVDAPFFGRTRGANAETLLAPLRAPDVQARLRDCVHAWAHACGVALPAVPAA